SWQALERLVVRLLLAEGFEGARLVGQTGDRGADVIAHASGKRWLFQVKHWKARVGIATVDKTVEALHTYRADIPVIVALNGFDETARNHRATLHREGFPLQLWDRTTLIERANRLPNEPPIERQGERYDRRNYQEEAITTIATTYLERHARKALIVMAT